MEKPVSKELKTNDVMRLFELTPVWKKLLSYLQKNTYPTSDRPKLQSIHVEEDRIIVTDGFEIIVVEFEDKDKQILPLGDWHLKFLGSKLAMLIYYPHGYPSEWEKVFDYKNIDKIAKRRISFDGVKTDKCDMYAKFGITARLLSRVINTGLGYPSDIMEIIVGDKLIMMNFRDYEHAEFGHMHIYAAMMPALFRYTEEDKRTIRGISMMYSVPESPDANSKN